MGLNPKSWRPQPSCVSIGPPSPRNIQLISSIYPPILTSSALRREGRGWLSSRCTHLPSPWRQPFQDGRLRRVGWHCSSGSVQWVWVTHHSFVWILWLLRHRLDDQLGVHFFASSPPDKLNSTLEPHSQRTFHFVRNWLSRVMSRISEKSVAWSVFAKNGRAFWITNLSNTRITSFYTRHYSRARRWMLHKVSECKKIAAAPTQKSLIFQTHMNPQPLCWRRKKGAKSNSNK